MSENTATSTWKNVWTKVNTVLDWPGKQILRFGKFIHMDIYKFYLIAAILLGVGFSFLFPIDQVPDESNHVKMMEEAIGADGIVDQYYGITTMTNAVEGVAHGGQAMDLQTYLAAWSVKWDKTAITWGHGMDRRVLNYLPYLVGFLIAYLLGLPVLWTLQLGEICCVAFATFLGYKSLKLIPIKKELYCAILLMPMVMQQVASINYDSVMLPLSFFYMAYLFYLKYRDEDVQWKNMALIIGILLWIANIKILYVLLAFFFFIIPVKKWGMKIGKWQIGPWIDSHKAVSVAVLALVIIAGCIIIRNVEYVMAVTATVLEPNRGIHLYLRTFLDMRYFYLDSLVGNFGWLDTVLPHKFVLLMLFSLVAFAQTDNGKYGKLDWHTRGNLAIVSMIIIFLIVACMITWSFYLADFTAVTLQDFRDGIYQIGIIEGVQGRYFFPVLFACVVFWEGIVKLSKEKLVVWQILYYVSLYTFSIRLIIDRMWI